MKNNSFSQSLTLFWYRRDLRLTDNAGLFHALKNNQNVLGLFIFDIEILQNLESDDRRVLFIYQKLAHLKTELQKLGSDILIEYGRPIEIFKKLNSQYKILNVYTNHDYEPAAIARDIEVQKFLHSHTIQFLSYKDQCLFEKKEVLTDQQKNYTVFTPYKKKWLSQLSEFYIQSYPVEKYYQNLILIQNPLSLPDLNDLGFQNSDFKFPEQKINLSILKDYHLKRDYPGLEKATSLLGIHLRFGTLSPRLAARVALKHSEVWLSEIIWRDFFMQILWHFPHVVNTSFRPDFEKVQWRQNADDFESWCTGNTGYPLVDAGMRELNTTGHMHNRVRMVTASFLTKHLLMHWSLGERYFAAKLLDYDLSANNGNWQWAAGTGCDAAPYFRIFNPTTQMEKFDSELKYVKKWVPEYGTNRYRKPIVEHSFARERALAEFNRTFKGK